LAVLNPHEGTIQVGAGCAELILMQQSLHAMETPVPNPDGFDPAGAWFRWRAGLVRSGDADAGADDASHRHCHTHSLSHAERHRDGDRQPHAFPD